LLIANVRLPTGSPVKNRQDLNGAEGGGSTFEQFLEFVPDAIVGVGQSGRIVLVNQHAEELFGYGREELEDHTLDRLVPERFRDRHPKQREHFFKEPRRREMGTDIELFGLRKDGSEFPAQISLSSIEWNGETIATAAVRDISKHSEGEREKTQRRAIRDLQASHRETVERLAGAIEMYDPQSDRHVNQVASIAALLGTRLGLDTQRMLLLRAAAPMHDVGNISIPDSVLRKPGKMTASERERMKLHTLVGHQILANSVSDLLKMAASIALTHHEWFDGSGYPQGLSGEEIPVEGRLVAVADVLDALLSDRPYRAAMGRAKAMTLIVEERGTHFDPEIIDVLLDNLDEALTLRSGAPQ
jgi:PAS domain S-box-containing protein